MKHSWIGEGKVVIVSQISSASRYRKDVVQRSKQAFLYFRFADDRLLRFFLRSLCVTGHPQLPILP